jgi:hypothetical protein
MYVSHSAAELRYPEPHSVLGEGLARDMESKIAAIHQIHNNVTGCLSAG